MLQITYNDEELNIIKEILNNKLEEFNDMLKTEDDTKDVLGEELFNQLKKDKILIEKIFVDFHKINTIKNLNLTVTTLIWRYEELSKIRELINDEEWVKENIKNEHLFYLYVKVIDSANKQRQFNKNNPIFILQITKVNDGQLHYNSMKDINPIFEKDLTDKERFLIDSFIDIDSTNNITQKVKNERFNKLLEIKENIELMKSSFVINAYYWLTNNLHLNNLIKVFKTEKITNNTELLRKIKPMIESNLLIREICIQCKSDVEFYPTSRANRDEYLNTINKLCKSCNDLKLKNKKIQEEQNKIEKQKKQQELLKIEEKTNKLKTMPYKEYLQTDHWKETRSKALKKANYKCELCNGTHELNVHHKTYENRGNEKPEDLIVLCHDCHAKFHDKLHIENNDKSIENNTYIIPNNDTEILNQLLNTLHISKEELLIYMKCKEKLNGVTF